MNVSMVARTVGPKLTRAVRISTFQTVVRVTERIFAESSFFELLKESIEIDMHWFRWNSHYGIRMSSFSFRS